MFVTQAALLCVFTVLGANISQDEAGGSKTMSTSSGLQYEVVEAGDGGDHPKMGDTVKVHYTGTLTDGSKFDSSRDRGQPAEFKLGQVIPGWNEGLQLMTRGARFRFTIPSDLAYGDRGSPPAIPPKATLIFDVELLDFSEGPTLPTYSVGITENQKTTESGLVYEVLEAGTGEPCSADDTVQFNYALFGSEGNLLDCSQLRGAPVKANASQMSLPFFKEALQLMNEGARWRFVVPSDLAFKEQAIPGLTPGASTVWEIDIDQIIKPMAVPPFSLPSDDELTETDSGLKYKVIKEGAGTSPEMGQEVMVHYAGWLTDGTPFDSSFSRGDPSTFKLGQVIAGWNEALQQMKPGGVMLLVIPPELGYGPSGRPPKIPPNATLVFHVVLLDC